MEAFSLGKPVIATDVIGNKEIVNDNYNGFLVQLNEYHQLSKKISYMLHIESTEYDRLSKNALRTYYNEFSYDKYRENIIRFFENKQEYKM